MSDQERFDNIRGIWGRLGAATGAIHAAIDQMEDYPADPEVRAAQMMGLLRAVATYSMESTLAVSSLAAMLAVVADKTDMPWMLDGPGISMEDLGK